jgi:hypothetical protein
MGEEQHCRPRVVGALAAAAAAGVPGVHCCAASGPGLHPPHCCCGEPLAALPPLSQMRPLLCARVFEWYSPLATSPGILGVCDASVTELLSR